MLIKPKKARSHQPHVTIFSRAEWMFLDGRSLSNPALGANCNKPKKEKCFGQNSTQWVKSVNCMECAHLFSTKYLTKRSVLCFRKQCYSPTYFSLLPHANVLFLTSPWLLLIYKHANPSFSKCPCDKKRQFQSSFLLFSPTPQTCTHCSAPTELHDLTEYSASLSLFHQ